MSILKLKSRLSLLLLLILTCSACLSPPGPRPTPDPNPPGPTPIVPGKLAVLILEEYDNRAKLPSSQVSALYSSTVREYLNTHCDTEQDGTPQWRLLDDDVDTSTLSPFWQEMLALPHASTPWIVITTGKDGIEGPLPTTERDLMALLQQWGG